MSCGLTPHVFVPLGQLLLPLLLELLAVHYLPTLRSKVKNLLSPSRVGMINWKLGTQFKLYI